LLKNNTKSLSTRESPQPVDVSWHQGVFLLLAVAGIQLRRWQPFSSLTPARDGVLHNAVIQQHGSQASGIASLSLSVILCACKAGNFFFGKKIRCGPTDSALRAGNTQPLIYWKALYSQFCCRIDRVVLLRQSRNCYGVFISRVSSEFASHA
jgi:hypothetical protein